MKFAAVFSIIVGMGMNGQWLMSYLTRQIPELKSEPIRIAFHIAAEMATALMLLIGGITLLSGMPFAREIYLVATGMLFYTAIVSPGYFAQKGVWTWVGIFAVLIIMAIAGVTAVV
ncbi:MAG TPA: hypothetical protein VMW28_03435 [Pelolinea sp.]|nr:hypothetical protein [Pelolinea sp.]